MKDLVAVVAKGDLAMVAMSASLAFSDSKKLAAAATKVARAGAKCHTRMVMGGRGAWPESLPGASRLTSYRAFNALLRAESKGSTA